MNLNECIECTATDLTVKVGTDAAGVELLCDEVCGDGKDYGINECEDGNPTNGDGCTATTCLIE